MTTRTPEQYKFPTLEFNDRLLTKHYTPLGGFDKRFFVVHHMTIVGTGNGDALDKCYDTWQNREASAQYGVDGIYVTQFVLDKDYAWAAGNTYGNLYGIHVEHANSTAGPKWLVDNATVLTGARLIANGHILYKLGRPVDQKTLFQHDNFYATACPGPYLGGTYWPTYVQTVQRFYDEITGTKPVETPTPIVRTAVWNKPETWVLGAVGPDVTKLGERIVVWSKALGLASPYKTGPGEPYGPADVVGLQNLQKAWGYGSTAADLAKGGSSDGYPGLQSFDKLLSDPPVAPTPTPDVPVTKLSVLHWNVAGSDSTNGFGKLNGSRGDDVGRYALRLGFDVFLTCEAGQDNLRAGISSGLGVVGKTEWMQRAKAIWYSSSNVKNFSSRKVYSDNLFAYLNTLKWGAAFFGVEDGKKFSILEIHTDYRAPAKQAKQIQSIFKKWRADCDALGIKHVNTFVVGDFNWDGTSGDNPFTSLDAWNFHEKGSRTEATFLGRKHLDGVLAHREADVEVDVKSRYDGKMYLSDHNPVKFVAILQ